MSIGAVFIAFLIGWQISQSNARAAKAAAVAEANRNPAVVEPVKQKEVTAKKKSAPKKIVKAKEVDDGKPIEFDPDPEPTDDDIILNGAGQTN